MTTTPIVVSGAADVWAVGVMAYECLEGTTGVSPYNGKQVCDNCPGCRINKHCFCNHQHFFRHGGSMGVEVLCTGVQSRVPMSWRCLQLINGAAVAAC
jgi:hypothetical protein